MGFFGDPSNRFRDYLEKIQNDEEIRCAFFKMLYFDLLLYVGVYRTVPHCPGAQPRAQ